jgi:hypothetical protein
MGKAECPVRAKKSGRNFLSLPLTITGNITRCYKLLSFYWQQLKYYKATQNYFFLQVICLKKLCTYLFAQIKRVATLF